MFFHTQHTHTHTQTHTHNHKRTHTITQVEKVVVSLTLCHISCHRSFGEKGLIKKQNKKTTKYTNNLLHKDDNHRRHHHHHAVLLAQISLTHSHHFSQSVIASCRPSGLYPVSSHSRCMYVRAGHPAFAWPYAGVHRSTSLMSPSLLLQQCPAYLVRLILDSFRDGRQVAV